MSTQNLQLVTTGDGSKTIYNPLVGENYHSKHGALQESQHVFLKSGLQYYLDNNETSSVSILEVGFGTGLNFLLSANYCVQHQLLLHYTGIEAFPLPIQMIQETGHEAYVEQHLYQSFLENYERSLNNTVRINNFIELEIAHDNLLRFNNPKLFDVLYFDAFAAIHQPEMWTHEALSHCCNYLKPDGVFVTYAITGNLKRIMKGLNFSIEKAPGAPGKREMLRAVKH
ncbi:tRNA (5-methylaminomethyl-2-thiouridine)(34)-methyltransferase MnmD [Paradesertivirga mongoliensis]|uniref:tRNA (5-methylaminomethyl-2-thiouridine)(34)-methyltransferase MnmD n=1 Tax=Paradesertivirga mongoliensis TaxID=2100740 RepID=A0ABW4ZLE0_9SPHI|nr:tRNA (5-methylaminomethyl-2-thiouridine)(34)-methyltransferase MnmD [Pedobacter mongoliensis]